MKRTKRRNGRQVPQLHERRERAPDVATDDWVPKFVWDADAELRLDMMERWTIQMIMAGQRQPWQYARPVRPDIYVPRTGTVLTPGLIGVDGKPLSGIAR